jgi:hypothetical protein
MTERRKTNFIQKYWLLLAGLTAIGAGTLCGTSCLSDKIDLINPEKNQALVDNQSKINNERKSQLAVGLIIIGSTGVFTDIYKFNRRKTE